MSDVEYSTPKFTPRLWDNDFHIPSRPEMSDSEESTGSTSSVPSQEKLSLLAEFDELMRMIRQNRSTDIEESFIDFVSQTEGLFENMQLLKEEIQRLHSRLEQKSQSCDDMEARLKTARKLLDRERKEKNKIEEECNQLKSQIELVRDIFFNDNNRCLPDETREKLAFLNNITHLSAIQEIETTGSLLSNFSYTKSEDDLDVSSLNKGKTWKTHRPSTDNVPTEPTIKKRRTSSNKVVEIGTSDKVRAITTVTVEKDGPITATSIIESIPAEMQTLTKPHQKVQPGTSNGHGAFGRERNNNMHYEFGQNKRPHCFHSKVALVVPSTCSSCDKRINFGKSAFKCKNCRAVCHQGCKDNLPLPCIPLVNTPTQKGNSGGVIGDYTPSTPPMIPALIVHCVNEIESRGLNDVGLYRVPGSEGDVKSLKERFLKGKYPSLHSIDVNVLCSTIKSFLKSLNEPLVTYALRKDFVRAINASDEQDVVPSMCQIISELPQPNRDTLACLMTHFKKVADSKACKMPLDNIAKAIGPTIVGYASDGISTEDLLEETKQMIEIMMVLLNMPTDYWSEFYYVKQYMKTPMGNLQQTPSTDSLLRPGISQEFFTPVLKRTKKKRHEMYFQSPPPMK